jgi:cobalt-zinc-cadmium efflux system membrane fusion protein
MGVKASVGAMVAPGGDPLVEIADASRLWLVADVPETDAASVVKGQRVTVDVPSQNSRVEGVIDGLGSQVDAETRRLSVYVALQGDLAGLTPGMQAEMRFSGEKQDMLVLPVEAVLIKDGKHNIVYVQQPDGRFVPREVRTGASKGGMVPILDGLKRGERVVVKGALLLDGEAEQLL